LTFTVTAGGIALGFNGSRARPAGEGLCRAMRLTRRGGFVTEHPLEGGFREFPERFNMADYFLYERIAEGMGDRVAIKTPREELTYAQIVEESNKVGNALKHLNLNPEDRVLIALHDTPEFVATIFGTLRLGGVVAMVNPLLSPEEFRYYLEYTRCRFFICASEVAEKIAPFSMDVQTLEAVLVVGEERPQGALFRSFVESTMQESGKLDAFPTHRDDPAYWLFTSGTTGKPKANIHLQHDFPWNCERYALRTIGYTQKDVTLSVPKLFFGYATGSNLFFPFAVGGTSCLFRERATPEAIFEHVERLKPTLLVSVPTMILQMVNHPDAAKHDLRHLRAVFSAGEALPAEIYRKWKETFGVEVLDGIGSAELFHIYITNRPGDVVPGSLGKLVPGYKARIVGEDGMNVPHGDIGTLLVKGDSAAVGYFQAHEKSKETFRGDWVKSADLFRMDEHGRFWYSGRTDDILKVGGIFVSPIEIEDCLLSHAAVAECAVVAYKEQGLEKPLALVVAKEGAAPGPVLAGEIAQFVKSTIAPYKFPRRVKFVKELPKNDRGKVERKALRDAVNEEFLAGSFDTDAAAPPAAAKTGGGGA
jgi:benzoate-CoA ligase family protein